MFTDRKDAGRQLAKSLSAYRDKDPLVLVIPRGGVPVGFEVASDFGTCLSLLIVQKLPFPYNPEAGFGAVAEDGSLVLLPGVSRNLNKELIETIIADQKREIDRRIHILRGNRSLPELAGRKVILVDDGIAMGSSMRAGVKCLSGKNPAEIIVATPVASPEASHALSQMEAVNKVVILEEPRFFHSVAQSYQHWKAVPDYEVISLLNQCKEFSR
jgi:putative phosphoribosyl transferase